LLVGRPGRKRREDNIDTNLVRLGYAHSWLSIVSVAGYGVLNRFLPLYKVFLE
jgi:hypothetical protein